MKRVDELNIIMQRNNANLLHKKVQNKQGEQVNLVYDIMKYGAVRKFSLTAVFDFQMERKSFFFS